MGSKGVAWVVYVRSAGGEVMVPRHIRNEMILSLLIPKIMRNE